MIPILLPLFLATAVVLTPPACTSVPAVEADDVKIHVSDGRGHACSADDPCLVLDTIGVFAETSTPGALLNCPFQTIVQWKFSDGNVQPTSMATQTFMKPGNYEAVLTINPQGITRTVHVVIVERPPSPLHVRMMADERWSALQFVMTDDFALPGEQRLWRIEYGDGLIGGDYAAIGIVLRHQYAKAGTYIATAYSQTFANPSTMETYKFVVTIVEPVRRRIIAH